MTTVEGGGSPGAGSIRSASPGTAAPPVSGEVPRRADGVQLIGEMAGSGYRTPASLVRRADGQTIQLTALLYAVLDAVDGRRDLADVAEQVSQRLGRQVSADNVRTLVEGKLRPLGLLLGPDGRQPALRRSNPLLALRFKYAVTDPERTRRLTAPFTVLFRPFAVVPLLAAFAVVCWWVLFHKGLASATYQAFDHPGLLLLVVAVTVLSAGFHEFGHAAAARYGGSTPGVMGAGVYLMWPAFYTDVTDSYRLGRLGRVRTDLGGLYFNAIVAVLISGVWAFTRYDALLLVVAAQILQMIRQLTPLVRFDGYHVLADVTGVPDLFHRIKPTLLGALPWRWGDPEARLLKPWARAVVTIWVLVVVPLLLCTLLLMVLALPHVLATAWAKLQQEQDVLATAWRHGDGLQVAARVLAMAAVALPIGGTFLVLGRTGRRLAVGIWRKTAGHPLRRTAAGVTAAALAAGLAYAWWPHPGTYQPVRPWQRGTVLDAVSAVAAPRPAAPGYLSPQSSGSLRVAWDQSTPLPTADHPQLAVVLIPRGSTSPGDSQAKGESAQGWVFPFDKPLAPGPGDNQALAVNTTDGTVDYDVAFALVWADGSAPALNKNEAYAFASCTSCASVAVAFQVVLVVGDNHLSAPENLAGALNYKCVNCLTYALAQQLFVTVRQPLSDASMAQLDLLWQQIAAYGQDIASGKVSLSTIQSTLDGYQQQIKDIIEADQPGTFSSPAASASATATATDAGASPTPSPSAATSPTATSSATGAATPAPSPSSASTPTAASTPTPTPSPSATATASPTG